MNKITQNSKNNLGSNHNSIKELCNQSPFLIIKTSCGVGRYKFNSIGYDNKDELVLEYKLINDNKYSDTNLIKHNMGKFYYLSATQVLYAFHYIAKS